MAEDTRAWLTSTMTSLLGCAEDQMVDAATPEQLGADSLDMVEITMAIEDHFHVKVADAEMAAIANVGELLALIDGKVAAR